MRIKQIYNHFACSYGKTILIYLVLGSLFSTPAGLEHVLYSQISSSTADAAHRLSGTWQGTLNTGRALRIVFKIVRSDDGVYSAVAYSIDQNGTRFPVAHITFEGLTVRMSIPAVEGSYVGRLSTDGLTITGQFDQGSSPQQLNLTRATPATEWTIPPPPTILSPMSGDANPSFEVATIKPTKPDERRSVYLTHGRRYLVINQSVKSIIAVAFGVQAQQIVNLPAWAETNRYDIEAEADGTGQPSDEQWRSMLQKLVRERYRFAFHRANKELSVYVLEVAKSGPKLIRSIANPIESSRLNFSALGDLHVHNATMEDFCDLMQNAVLDRPVVDRSGLVGRYDFELKWSPDNSQFVSMGVQPVLPSDDLSAIPNLYTAIQEQIGLKLKLAKEFTDVLVVDHIDKAPDN